MGDFDPCPNCSSTKHGRCCARCGGTFNALRIAVGSDFCSAKCGEEQTREDKLSDATEKESVERKRKTPWTKKRLDSVINAVTAMMAGEEGEGDWDPRHSTEDMEAGLRRLQEEREALEK